MKTKKSERVRGKSRRTPSAGEAIRKAGLRQAGKLTKRLLDAQRGMWKAGVSTLQQAGQSAFPDGASGLSTVVQEGIRRLEDVFDERVTSALARTGVPAPSVLRNLVERIDRLEKEVGLLQKRLARTKPPRRTTRS